jgi:uncharacterized protein YgbK (DUF1537 family)
VLGPTLGCIADDFTGATDVGNTWSCGGLEVVQLIGIPDPDVIVPPADCYVVALKSRTIERAEAVRESTGALAWLQASGARRYYFKYCSTFDSSERGNIGPVADALLNRLGSDFTVVCPAFPANGRTVYAGHLFVDGVPLSESHMARHPLTPMADSNLVRLLASQTQARVGSIAYEVVAKGHRSIRAAADELIASGVRYAVADAIRDHDLREIAEAFRDLPLLTGASGLAAGMVPTLQQKMAPGAGARPFDIPVGPAVVLAGSSSPATRAQVDAMKAVMPSLRLDPMKLVQDGSHLEEAVAWALQNLGASPILVYSTSEPDDVARTQAAIGAERAASVLEDAAAEIARAVVADGARRLIVAGGETSGAVVNALGVRVLRIGRQIAPGVPWTFTIGDRPLALALKSGNFGPPRFFLDAWAKLGNG